ncbi:MAG TPA: HAD family acid phosphatase [Desulfobacteraceae bacterium]|nr:HAD family acid phosphatase [Desulfobacteraceae bacterium]
MKHTRFILIPIVAIMFLISACATPGNSNLNSLLWMQTSSEYKASCLQTYNTAKKNIDAALNDRGWTAALEQNGEFLSLPAAVVMDIDDTVLDSAKFQAKLINDGVNWSETAWDEWVAFKNAPPVPGAVDFIQAINEKKIEVFFITNRECRQREKGKCKCPQEQDTIDNLVKVGISGVNPENVLLQNEQPEWSSDKKSRREFITARYRVLMLFGDDLGDFLPNVKKNITPLQRDALVHKNEIKWGIKWYMLSNPVYGSWLKILEEPRSRYSAGY